MECLLDHVFAREPRRKFWRMKIVFLLTALGIAQHAAALEAGMPNPPESPTIVKVGVFLADIINLDEVNETFEAEFVLGARWVDPRLAFDPVEAGADEKLYQGSFQFDEVYAGWWPQLLIVNEVGSSDPNAMRLVVHADGRVHYLAQRNVILETPMQLQRFPFDTQTLEANIIAFGNSRDEVLLEVDQQMLGASEEYAEKNRQVDIAQWHFENLDLTSGVADFRYDGSGLDTSEIHLAISLRRQPGNFIWKVIVPLIVLVLLMWAVFWLDVDTLAERLNLAFIGVLTIVAYQFLIDGTMPRISYFTFTDAILLYSFVIMCMAILESVVVYSIFRAGRRPLAERVDLIAQWVFPVVYFTGLAASYVYYRGGAS